MYRKLSEKVPANEAVPSNRDYYMLPEAEKVERFGEAWRCLVLSLKRFFQLERMGLVPAME